MKFVALDPSLIDEGEFQAEFEECVKEAAQILIRHRDRFGDESHKASVEVVGKVKMIITNPKEGDVAIKWGVDIKRPKRPEGFSTALTSTDDDGNANLFVKSGGSDGGNARQTKFATADGRAVDNDSGVVELR